jgi:gliding motility-associated-like protein
VDGFQMTNNGMQDAVLFKVSADFSTLLWSTYFGGTKNDAGYSVKLDSDYNVILTGGTTSSVLVGMAGGYQPTFNGGKADGYVLKVSPDGAAVIQGSFIGTGQYDQTFFVEIDRYDNIYVVGQTFGVMPISPGVYNNPGSSQFIWKFAPDLLSTEFTTVFGNGASMINISPSAFLVDVCGNIYVSGWGASVLGGPPLTGMPISDDALYPTTTGFDFYLMVLEREAQSLLYATYMGGPISQEHVDGGTSRFDKYGIVYQSVCGGCGGNSDFPTTPDAHSNTNESSNCNNLIFKFDFEIIPLAKFEVAQLEGCAPLTLTFENESNDTVNFEWDFGPDVEILSGGVNPVVLFEEPGTYEVTLLITDTICNLTDSAVKIITVYDELQLEVPNDTIVCDEINYDLIANSYGTATSFIWSTDLSFGTMLNDDLMDSVININPITTTTYYVKASNGWELCDLIDSVTVTFVSGAMEVSSDQLICLGDTVLLNAQSIIEEIDISFEWSPDEFLVEELGGVAIGLPNSSMYYYVTGTTDSGCVIEDSVWVAVTSIDESTIYATATPDIVAEGANTFLEAFPEGYEYLWFLPEGVENPDERTTNAIVNSTRTFDVYMTDGICTAKTQVTVTTYEFVCGDVFIYVPNAFSPNGDNQNDILYVRGQNLEKIQFKIFDRWGELVFESTDQSVGWDGTFKGVPVDPDVFVYHLKVICFDGQENLIKGNVTVLK